MHKYFCRYQGKVELKRAVPDSITSWVLTAFSVNDAHGLGLIEQPRKVVYTYILLIFSRCFLFNLLDFIKEKKIKWPITDDICLSFRYQLKVFKPFFITVDLPYSVIRGEIVGVQIVVFNYMNKDVTAEVLLYEQKEFDFAEVSNEVHDVPSKCQRIESRNRRIRNDIIINPRSM